MRKPMTLQKARASHELSLTREKSNKKTDTKAGL